MRIQDLIKILNNRLFHLTAAKQTAEAMGDLDRLASLENEIVSTQNTLSQIQTLG